MLRCFLSSSASSSSRRTWIEMLPSSRSFAQFWSSSSRRTWIEMSESLPEESSCPVVLLAEDVDRNAQVVVFASGRQASSSSRRTWIEISLVNLSSYQQMSSSSRRTWIEIPSPAVTQLRCASSSSRRTWIEMRCCCCRRCLSMWSSSLRRTWIEMSPPPPPGRPDMVVLLAEDVDRNYDRQ